MAKRRLILNEEDEAAVRMYGQGFGDCFLLALPRAVKDGGAPDRSNPVYVVIDCGVFYRTPRQKDRMVQVTKSVKGATGGVIDLLVATHEHYDHMCGFEDAKEDWKEIEVRQIWLAWTEDGNNPFTKRYDREKEALALQLTHALQIAEFYADQDDSLMAAMQRALALAAFGGESFPILSAEENEGELVDDEVSLPADHPFGAPSNVSKLPNDVLGDFAIDPTKRFAAGELAITTAFCEPGQIRRLPESEVDAYVLGPPTDAAFLGLSFKEDEVYADETGAAQLRAAAIQGAAGVAFASAQAAQQGFALALERYANTVVQDKDAGKLDTGAPFGEGHSVHFQQAREEEFFQEHYFDLPPELQITTDWLQGAGSLALQLDELTNNTSLVLAFRLSDGRFLLFVGDAQVGNWLSWHTIEPDRWRRPDGGAINFRPTAREILENTVLYKVGHHGSHNATLATNGLEMMGDGFVAFVPSSREIPQAERKEPWMIPFEPLMNRLRTKTNGQIILPHEAPDALGAGMQIETAGSDLPAMRRDGKVIESPVPLWRQVRIQRAAL